jgi:hypothetical protein
VLPDVRAVEHGAALVAHRPAGVVPPLMRRPRRCHLSVPRHTKFVSTKFET